jgi:hypothetical protein
MAYAETAGSYQGAAGTLGQEPHAARLGGAVSRLDELAKRLSRVSEVLAGQVGPSAAPPGDRNRPALVSPSPGLIEARADDLHRIAARMAADLELIERLLP